MIFLSCLYGFEALAGMYGDDRRSLEAGTYKDSYDYLIITQDTFKDGWNLFVAFNKRRCLRTKIETVQNISATVAGTDLPEKIRTYIKQEYQNSGISYVLLGGNTIKNSPNDIPARGFRAQMYDNQIAPDRFQDAKDLPAEDLYYGCLDGDWKNDSTAYYGEPGSEDFTHEVYVGRFPVNTLTELANLINKTIKYSEYPVKEQVTNNLLAGGYMWTVGVVTLYGDDYEEEFAGVCTTNTFTTTGFPKDAWNTVRCYAKEKPWDISNLRDSINTHKPAWFSYTGAGSSALPFQETSSGVTNANYQNDGTNANFFIIKCNFFDSHDYSKTGDVIEKLLTITNGAVASVANSNFNYEDDDGTNGISQRVYRQFHDALFNPQKQIHYIGMMLANAKKTCFSFFTPNEITTPPYFGGIRHAVYQITLLGDPALSVWTEKPKEWAQLPVYTLGTDGFEMKTPAHTWIALAGQDGKMYHTQLTDMSGQCKIPAAIITDYFNQNPGAKDFQIRIKAHNYLPYAETVNPTLISTDYSEKLIHAKILSNCHSLHISYYLLRDGLLNISIYNARGILINTLLNTFQKPGEQALTYNTSGLPNGIYYCRMLVGEKGYTGKFAIIK